MRALWRICSQGMIALVYPGQGSSLPAISKEVQRNWR
jgi:hypothetical protein